VRDHAIVPDNALKPATSLHEQDFAFRAASQARARSIRPASDRPAVASPRRPRYAAARRPRADPAPSWMQQPPSACGLRLQPTGPGGFPPESRWSGPGRLQNTARQKRPAAMSDPAFMPGQPQSPEDLAR